MVDNGNILIIDDEVNAVKVLSAILSAEGYTVYGSYGVDEAVGIIGDRDIDVVVTDMSMPEKDGNYMFDYMSEYHSDIPVIFLTAYGTVESAVTAMKHGAFDYFIKPPDPVRLRENIAKAVEIRRLRKEVDFLRKRVPDEGALNIIGQTSEMHKMFETIKAVRDSESTVLIYGETGTGKELTARALHFTSRRKSLPFIPLNCAAIPRELMEAELFGYEKGAFTGATSTRLGKFEEAAGGTVFLDEIGEMDIGLQAKLLRVLESKEVVRVGSNRQIRVNFRLIASTNRRLEEEVPKGNFRSDLFYRINVITIPTIPLRERIEDIPLLVSAFVNEFCLREKKLVTISPDVVRIFQRYPWPGNVRQVRNAVERLVVLARTGKIRKKDLPDEILRHVGNGRERSPEDMSLLDGGTTLKEIENQAVMEALSRCKGNKSKAARILGISRKAFYRKLEEINSGSDMPHV
jgi:DNA-binding NtrC family response regulator